LHQAAHADKETAMERGGRHNRRSIRLKGYDYTRDGAYFVTICTQGREHTFGVVIDGEMRPNVCGREVARCWAWLAEQYPYVCLDEWIVMPDHTHAIIMIKDAHRNGTVHHRSNAANSDDTCRGGSRTALMRTAPPTGSVDSSFVPTQRKPLGRLIGAFKTVSTKRVNDIRSTPGARLWQRNYYERVIRNGASLDSIRHYIANNPTL
jgi:REP-associated tyrosine transposase